MNKDTVKGKMKKVEGRVQQKAGKWTGSKEAQLRGLEKQVEGKMQEGVGKLKDAGRDVVNRMPAPGKSREKQDLPEEEYQDRRMPKKPESDVVPNRDDDIGEEVA